MAQEKVLKYIITELKEGFSEVDIRKALLKSKYSKKVLTGLSPYSLLS